MQALTLLHRWLAVPLAPLFAMWFASGIVMHVVPYPALSEGERTAGLAPIDLARVTHGRRDAVVASGIADAQGEIVVIAGGNGMALGAVAAWFAIRRGEAHHAIDQDYDRIGVAVAAAVLLALPIFESTADVFAGLVGGAVGGLAGLAASALRPSD